MPEMNNEAFLFEQQQAVERMREMSRRALTPNPHEMPPVPNFVRMPENTVEKETPTHSEPVQTKPQKRASPSKPHKPQSFLSGILPKRFPIDSDTALILGLILILSSENTDKLLLYALVYILL